MTDFILPALLFSTHFIIWDYPFLPDAQGPLDDLYNPLIKIRPKASSLLLKNVILSVTARAFGA
jgi:hypothetical protein